MKSLAQMVLAALFTGLMVAGALITIPFPQVPLVIADAIPWLAALILGPAWAAVSTVLYLLLGAFGLPVFAQGTAGVGVLFGPTGGFLIGYVLSALVVGALADRKGRSVLRNSIAVFAGLVVVYAAGIPWLAFVAFKGLAGFEPVNLMQAAVWGTSPAGVPFLFVIGDAIKAVGVIGVATVLKRIPAVVSLRTPSNS